MLFRLRADPCQWGLGPRPFMRECLPARTPCQCAQIAAIQPLQPGTAAGATRRNRHPIRAADARHPALLSGSPRPGRGRRSHRAGEAARHRFARAGAAECMRWSRRSPTALRPSPAACGLRRTSPAMRTSSHRTWRRCARLAACSSATASASSASRLRAGSGARAAGPRRGDRGDAYVVALGSYSPLALAFPGHFASGLSAEGLLDHACAREGDVAPQISLSDGAHKLVMSRLGNRLRVAGDRRADRLRHGDNEVRCRAIVRRHLRTFSPRRAGRRGAVLGRAASGHARRRALHRPHALSRIYCSHRPRHLGWTMACGSGAAIAEIASGRTPDLGFRFLGAP